MPRAFFSESIIATDNRGPLLIGGGLAIVLAAQLWPAIPLAAAIALIGLGATLTLKGGQQYGVLIGLNLVTYLSIVALAMLAELDSRRDILLLVDILLASGCSLASIICTCQRRLT